MKRGGITFRGMVFAVHTRDPDFRASGNAGSRAIDCGSRRGRRCHRSP